MSTPCRVGGRQKQAFEAQEARIEHSAASHVNFTINHENSFEIQ
jgi:hypothetical protein